MAAAGPSLLHRSCAVAHPLPRFTRCPRSEEIAFYNGAQHEKHVVMSMFDSLMRHVRRAQQYRFTIGVIDTFVAKCVPGPPPRFHCHRGH